MPKSSIRNALLFCMLAGSVVCLSAQKITGVARLMLNSPATHEHRQQIKALALDSLKGSIVEWMEQTHRRVPDSTRPVEWHHFMSFVEECAKSGEKESFVEQREWTLRIEVAPDRLVSLLDDHNARVKPLALKYWALAQEGIKHNRATVIFTGSVHTLYHALGYLGAPFLIERNNEPIDLKEESRKALQQVLDSLKIQYSSFIIKGKPGNSPDNFVTITAAIDSVPLAGLPFTASLPNGRHLFKVQTGTDGTTPLGEFSIPFVPYGTFLHIQPNLGGIVKPSLHFGLADFGLAPGEGHDQTLIFNIVKQSYTLDYKVSGGSQMNVPQNFVNGQLVRNFLEDSCNLIQSSSSNPSDLEIVIQTQVSSYTFDSREETEIKAEVLAKVKQLQSGGNQVEKTYVLNQKVFDSNHEIPTGLFFWETTSSLRNLLRDMLNSL